MIENCPNTGDADLVWVSCTCSCIGCGKSTLEYCYPNATVIIHKCKSCGVTCTSALDKYSHESDANISDHTIEQRECPQSLIDLITSLRIIAGTTLHATVEDSKRSKERDAVITAANLLEAVGIVLAEV